MTKEELGLSPDYVSRIIDCIVSAVPTKKIFVFGSFARGEETDASDIDLYVVTSDNNKRPLRYAADARKSLLWMDRPRDVLCAPCEVFEDRINDLSRVEYAVAHEGVEIYGR